jgi:hypothetical protein
MSGRLKGAWLRHHACSAQVLLMIYRLMRMATFGPGVARLRHLPP